MSSWIPYIFLGARDMIPSSKIMCLLPILFLLYIFLIYLHTYLHGKTATLLLATSDIALLWT